MQETEKQLEPTRCELGSNPLTQQRRCESQHGIDRIRSRAALSHHEQVWLANSHSKHPPPSGGRRPFVPSHLVQLMGCQQPFPVLAQSDQLRAAIRHRMPLQLTHPLLYRTHLRRNQPPGDLKSLER
jgi:hypothetical protein